MDAVAAGNIPDQPFRPVRTAPGLPAFHRTAVPGTRVPDAWTVPGGTTSDLFQLDVYLLGHAPHDGGAPGIRSCHNGLHVDGNSARGAGPDAGVWRCLSAIQAASSGDFADAFRPREDR